MADDSLQQVCVVIGNHSLHDSSYALQSHSCVNRRFGQRGKYTIRRAIELHEYIVPDLHIAVAVTPHGTFRAATPGMSPLVVEDFGAGTAGTGISHGPEVVLFTKAENPLTRNPFLLMPDVGCFIVIGKYGNIQAAFIQPQILG